MSKVLGDPDIYLYAPPATPGAPAEDAVAATPTMPDVPAPDELDQAPGPPDLTSEEDDHV